MSKRGGFYAGMPGNMNNLIKQAQRMQRQMEENKKKLAETDFTGSAGGGAVSVVLTGLKELKRVHIDPETVDPEDIDTLENMIVMAYDDAARKIVAESETTLSDIGAHGNAGFQ